MKFLIWFVVLFADSAFNTMLRESGIIIGGIPRAIVFILAFTFAAFLTMKWDYSSFKRKAKKAGRTPLEYAKTQYNTSIIDMCNTYYNDKTEFKKMLKQCNDAGTLSQKDCNILKSLFKDPKVLEEVSRR